MRHLARWLGFWVVAALMSGVGCCNHETSASTASNGGATTGASNGANNGSASASNGANNGSASASNGANNGNGSASNGSASNGSASNGGATNGSASNGGATNGGSASNGAASNGGSTGGSDCTLPQFITQSLELTTLCPVWYIGQGGTDVEGSAAPVLTVDPGVTLAAAAQGAYLLVGINQPGTLQVAGTLAKPVSFTSVNQTAGNWDGLLFGQNSSGSSMTYAGVSYAGGQQSGMVSGVSYPGAIVVFGDTAAATVMLSNVTVQNDGASGFVFAGPGAALAAGSGNLTASDWAAGSYPFVVDANQVGTIPTSLAVGTGSGAPLVAMACQGSQDCGDPLTVDHDQTWPALPMPYAILNANGVNVDGAGSSVATLTIAAPNTLEFVDGSSLQVDMLDLGQGELVAVGTAQNPIVFKSADATPLFSAWQGVQLVASSVNALAGTSIAYCDISDAMGFTTAIGGVPGNVSGEITVNGSLFTQNPDAGPIGPSIANCTFTNFGSCGIFTEDISNPGIYGDGGSGAAGNAFTPATGTAGDGEVLGDVCSI